MATEERTIRRVPILSYNEFRSGHLLPNVPVVIGPELINDWPCVNNWRLIPDALDHRTGPTNEKSNTPNSSYGAIPQYDNDVLVEEYKLLRYSQPNLNYFLSHYGDMKVPTDENECPSERKLKDVIDAWISNGELNIKDAHSTHNEEGRSRRIYATDWHLALELSRTEAQSKPFFYKTPELFRDDWVNRYYLKETNDDFRFVYIGPAGTSTLLHRDVYMSYSWSTNVVGRKRWWFFPPSLTQYITNARGDTIDFYLIDDNDLWGKPEADEVEIAMQKWPSWKTAKNQMYIIDQEEGETIFVPSGWYHQVLNLTFCISISHNWANAHNIRAMYDSMTKDVMRVEESISDVKELLQQRKPHVWEEEWEIAVQDLLQQDAGWGWATFWEMLLLNVEDCITGPEGHDFSSSPNNLKNGNTQEWKQETHPNRSHFSHSHDQSPQQECQKCQQGQEDEDSPIYGCDSGSTFSWRKESSPGREYILDQVAYCIRSFENSRWAGSRRYGSVIERIKGLIGPAQTVVP